MISLIRGLIQMYNSYGEITHSKKNGTFDAVFIVFPHNKQYRRQHRHTHDRFKLYFVK